jgi:predicted nucleic acid-binding protein
MPLNSEIIISDTSCLILLANINELSILKKLGKEVIVTPEISLEFGKPLPDWIKIRSAGDKHYQKLLDREIDKGEASAIVLSLEIVDSILIIDDLKGRKVAEELGVKYSGTLGLILRAKQEGFITSVKPIIDKIRNTNFRFSENLLTTVLELAGE